MGLWKNAKTTKVKINLNSLPVTFTRRRRYLECIVSTSGNNSVHIMRPFYRVCQENVPYSTADHVLPNFCFIRLLGFGASSFLVEELRNG